MIKKIFLLYIFLFLSSPAIAQNATTAPIFGQDACLLVEEEDGSPADFACRPLKFPNGSLTKNVNGTFSLAVGNINGPSSSTDNAIARYDGPTGKLLQDYTSNAPTIDDNGKVSLLNTFSLSNLGTNVVFGDSDVTTPNRINYSGSVSSGLYGFYVSSSNSSTASGAYTVGIGGITAPAANTTADVIGFQGFVSPQSSASFTSLNRVMGVQGGGYLASNFLTIKDFYGIFGDPATILSTAVIRNYAGGFSGKVLMIGSDNTSGYWFSSADGTAADAKIYRSAVAEISILGVLKATNAVLTTPDLGTPSALVGTNITGTASGFTSGHVTTNANLTGDVTSSGNATTLANIPTATPAVGSILHTNISAPSSPAAGKDAVYSDSTDLRLHDKNASGIIGTTVIADTGASNNFLTAISAAGAISKAQPAFSNLSGSVAASQMPALTGEATTSAGAVAVTLTNSAVIGKLLTGYSSGAGTVASTDTILQAIQKLNGNNATNANLTGPITSIGNATSIASQTGSGTKFVVDTAPTISNPVIANINPGADFTITQNSVVPFTSVNSGAIANTLYMSAGKIGINTTNLVNSLTIGSVTTGMAGLIGSGPGLSVSGIGSVFGFEDTSPSSSSSGALIRLVSNDGAAMSSGDRLGMLSFGGSISATTVNASATIAAIASENWVVGAATGTDLSFQITVPGINSRSEKLRVTGTGLQIFNSAAPSTSPTGLGTLYVESGALKFRGSSGTVTTIAVP